MVAVVDYNAGNIRSVLCALERLGADAVLTNKPEEILSADHVIFPGVGEASSAMAELENRDLISTLKHVTAPFLGICLGMQLMNAFSEEGNTSLLGLTDERVTLFPSGRGYKIPHVGWNTIEYDVSSPLFKGMKGDVYMYFVHSYYVPESKLAIAYTEYDEIKFTSALSKDNFFGVQFHPEKSGVQGERLLENFLCM